MSKKNDPFDGLNDDIDESVDSFFHNDDKSSVGNVGFGSSEDDEDEDTKVVDPKKKPKK